MSFIKKTWLARIGTGLNRFLQNGTDYVTLQSAPESVTQQGDALSADNMNNLEQRIADAFDALDDEILTDEPSTTDTTHALTNAVATQIHKQTNARLENLEQKAGDYVEVQYRGTDAVPTGKAKYGIVNTIVGKTRAWNQLCQNGNFASTSNWTSTRLTLSASDNVLSGEITAVTDADFSNRIEQSVSFASGHKVLISVGFYAVHSGVLKFRIKGDVNQGATASVVTGWNDINVIASTPSNTNAIYIGINGSGDGYSVGEIIKYRNCNFYDLTLIFGAGNEPSTVADALARIPDLGKYNAYDAGSLLSTVVSGVESRSKNLANSDLLLNATGVTKSDDVYSVSSVINLYNYVATDRPFSGFKPNTQYTIQWTGKLGTAVSVRFRALYTDGTMSANLCILTSTSWTSLTGTTDSGKTIDAFLISYGGNGSFQFKELQIEEGTVATPYSPYGNIDTLSLPETVTLRSVGEVHDTYNPETGVITRNVGVVDLGTSQDVTYLDVPILISSHVFPFSINGVKAGSYIIASGGFSCVSGATSWTISNDKTVISVVAEQNLRLRLDSCSSYNDIRDAMSGVYLAYELATPTTESIDPVPYNFIEVEGGGTVETIQEQTPVIDNCLDVGYLAL